MPVHQGRDNNGNYYQWGNQKKYYYRTKLEGQLAMHKAILQGIAIKYNEHHGGYIEELINDI